jgi:hypothetical protein
MTAETALLPEVEWWVEQWRLTKGTERISNTVARTIASYWQDSAETGALATFALGRPIDLDLLLEDIDSTIRYIHSGGQHQYEATIDELYALKAWALYWRNPPEPSPQQGPDVTLEAQEA